MVLVGLFAVLGALTMDDSRTTDEHADESVSGPDRP
jgi:hypothetical protein